MRLRLFYREPGAMFWTFGFPIVLTVVLGTAFRHRAPDPVAVAVEMGTPQAERAYVALASQRGVDVRRMAPRETPDALRTGRVSIVVVANEGGTTYRLDPTRPESRLARAVTDDVLQRASGRMDTFLPRTESVTARGSRYIDFLVPGLVGLGLMSTGLWGIGFSLAEMRAKKLLKRLLATPMRHGDFLFSFLLVRALLMACELPPILLFARYAFDVRIEGSIVSLAIVALVGGLGFAVMGLLIASRAESPQVVSGIINVVSFPMYLCSGIFFPSSRFPDAIQPVVRALPLTALNDALRAVMIDGASLVGVGRELGICAGWGIASFLLALKLFRWR